jgi:aldehyde dehydrogenase (NAD+)
MSPPDYTSLVEGQRSYFKAGKTRPASWRVEQLKAIKAMVEESRDAIREALWHDLRRLTPEASSTTVPGSTQASSTRRTPSTRWREALQKLM